MTRGQESRGAVAENLGELGRRRDLELVVATLRRQLVGTPAEKDGRVSEAIALHVVVLHLADALDPQRLPGQVLAGTPAALPARHPDRAVGCSGPVPPGM